MTTVSVHEAKTHLSRLLQRVADGEEILIANRGTVVARLSQPRRVPVLGADVGRFEVPDDFNAPLTEDELAGFER